ncbi:MAG: ParB/RepB/Spo0J family partition protein [Asticcacaulis sp.]|uniref:ParB/RepB/Spo0J family partition protein n=1 Tax=Asticcacaulis sp. TaxID=1872648 RepID=UPI003F7C5398
MNSRTIDLSALDAFVDPAAARASGKPLMLDIDLIQEDPDQPRKAFDDLIELAASISVHGVKVPISIRPHPNIPGNYMVKFGARRRRASIQAGLTQIPAWIDNVPSDFEQVIENLQRKDLTPMELAQFMEDKMACGMKVGEIAHKLAVPPSTVTKHLALINPPAEIEALYQTGRTTSPETIYELRSLHKLHPDAVKAWLAGDVEVTRRSVEDLKRRLKAEEGRGDEAANAAPKRGRPRRVDDPSEIKRPVIAVRVGERHGVVVLNRRANEDEHVLVKWDDTAEVDQVANREVVFLRLDDARRYEPINRGLTE